jgi:UDP-N-acetyl-2-amino-2-deoxyglucuronate dehydrogenase
MKSFKTAFIGCGRITKLHTAGYAQHPRFDVKTVADLKREAAEEFVEKNGYDAAIYTDYHEMLAAEKPDVVSICLWTDLHKQVVLDCCAAGVAAIHCEKPMAANWQDAQEMAAAAAAAGVQLTFNHQRRFRANYRTAKELLDAGHIGDLQRMDIYVHAHALDMGTHLVDLMFMYNHENPVLWVMGQLDAREVKQWFDIPYEFAACASVRFENNVRASLHVGDDIGWDHGFGIRLTGSRGILEVRAEHKLWIRQYGDAECQERQYDSDENRTSMNGVMADILAGLDGEHSPQLSAANALHATEVIFAIYESSRSRTRVDMPLVPGDSALVTMLKEGVIG